MACSITLGEMSILDEILAHKREFELPNRMRSEPLPAVRSRANSAPPPRDFARGLRRPDGRVALIAEVKRASPSKGDLVTGAFDPVALATTYRDNGASAISVLTDERYFKGSLGDLQAVAAAVDLPVLRKDFVVDRYQIYEARAAGAAAVLLIVAALDDARLRDFRECAEGLGIAALVEVHDQAEAERAWRSGARLIGVNNRDLRTFSVNLETTARCAAALPDDARDERTLVSESGIFTPDQVRRAAGMGAHAVLVGESIIVSGDVPSHVRALARVRRAA